MNGILNQVFDLNDENIQKDLEIILRHIPSYLDIAMMNTMVLVGESKMGRTTKKITCKNILALIQFS
jgi:hypothetical protein